MLGTGREAGRGQGTRAGRGRGRRTERWGLGPQAGTWHWSPRSPLKPRGAQDQHRAAAAEGTFERRGFHVF